MYICIYQRLFTGQSLALLCCMMTHEIGTFLLQNRSQLSIANIHLIKSCSLIDSLSPATYQIIDDKHIMPRVQVRLRKMRTNKTRPPNNRYFHSRSSFCLAFRVAIPEELSLPLLF